MANEFKVRKGLIVNGSGSVILDIQGSQGQLFSVTDQLSGSLFSVNDISGMPILGVSSDDSVRLGTFNREAIIVSGSNARITGSLFGTASWASNATTASNALTSSFVLNAVSASFAATASSVNPLVQNVQITGSTNLTGSLTVNGNSTSINSDLATTGNFTQIFSVNASGISRFFVRPTGDALLADRLWLGALNGNNSISAGTISLRSSQAAGNVFTNFDHNDGTRAIRAYTNSVVTLQETGGRNVLIKTGTDSGFSLDIAAAGVSGSFRSVGTSVVSGSLLTTGSFTLIGNQTITGSSIATGGYTGSLFGTSSWALNATTASFVLNAVSASFAATASSADDFLIRQNATASNLLVNNTITAQTLVVQTITSSVDFVTGSTRFGTQLTNTHQFTGSVSITGSLSLNNDPVVTQTPYNTFSSSIALRATNLESTASVLTSASASFAQQSGSNSIRLADLESTASILTTASASFALVSSSYAAFSQSYNTGSFTGSFTGTLIGTASWALNATTASFVLNAVSASFASTASFVNPLSQSVLVSGSIILSGSGVTYPLDVSGSARVQTQLVAGNGTTTQDKIIDLNIGGSGASIGYIGFTRTVATNDSWLFGIFNGGDFGLRKSIDSANTFAISNGGNTANLTKSISFGSGNGVVSVNASFINSLTNTRTYPVIIKNNSTGANGAVGYAFSSINSVGTEYTFATIEGYKLSNWSGAAPQGKLTFNVTSGSTTLIEAMSILNTANVLIGTTTDSGFRLDVSGSTRVTNNLTVSGSTLLTGSVQVTGSLNAPNITGSLFGTASWALNAVTSSFVLQAVSSSFATSASLAQTASFVLNAVSASFASTASSVNILNQPVSISGSFTVITGSGVEFQVTNTGVKIGNLASDFHTITGSIYQSGSSVGASLRGSGSAIFSVDGTVGRLFQVDDSLSGSLFSVNTAAGLPIIEAFSDNTVRIAQFGQRAFFVSQSVVGIGKESLLNGKLDVSGSTFITGSLNVSQGITGSLFGTSSWALNTTTASFVLNAVSASFAATASSADNFVVRQNATASNLLVNNTITAQTLVVQTITSSVLYSSGSNVFGNSLNNTQQFTGSVTITGSLSLNNSPVVTNTTFTPFSSSVSTRLVTLENASSSFALVSSSYSAFSQSYNTGSFTGSFTGTLIGTSSWAENALTSSYVLNAISASYALTSSNIQGGLATYVPLWDTNTSLTSSYLNQASDILKTVYNGTDRGLTLNYGVDSYILGNSGVGNSTYLQVFDGGSVINVYTPNYTYFNDKVGIRIIPTNPGLAVSGSLEVTGPGLTKFINTDIEVTGSINVSSGITGSLFGTASWAIEAVTSSYALEAVSSSFALTASYALNGGGSSAPTFPFTGSAVISGSLEITGSLNTTGSVFLTGLTSSSFANVVGYDVATGQLYFQSTGSGGGGGSSVTASYALTASAATDFTVRNTLTLDRSLMDYATVASSIVGSNNLFTQATGSYSSAFFKYTAANGANARSGEVMAVWNVTSVQFTDNSTLDIGSTTPVTCSVSVVGTDIQFNVQTNTSGWAIKSVATYM